MKDKYIILLFFSLLIVIMCCLFYSLIKKDIIEGVQNKFPKKVVFLVDYSNNNFETEFSNQRKKFIGNDHEGNTHAIINASSYPSDTLLDFSNNINRLDKNTYNKENVHFIISIGYQEIEKEINKCYDNIRKEADADTDDSSDQESESSFDRFFNNQIRIKYDCSGINDIKYNIKKHLNRFINKFPKANKIILNYRNSPAQSLPDNDNGETKHMINYIKKMNDFLLKYCNKNNVLIIPVDKLFNYQEYEDVINTPEFKNEFFKTIFNIILGGHIKFK